MDADRVIFSTQWIAVKESPRGFQYLERKGKDSVAVFLLRKSSKNLGQYEVLIRQQHLCIDNREIDGQFTLFPCPVTGALEEVELSEAAAQRESPPSHRCDGLGHDRHRPQSQLQLTLQALSTTLQYTTKPDSLALNASR